MWIIGTIKMLLNWIASKKGKKEKKTQPTSLYVHLCHKIPTDIILEQLHRLLSNSKLLQRPHIQLPRKWSQHQAW